MGRFAVYEDVKVIEWGFQVAVQFLSWVWVLVGLCHVGVGFQERPCFVARFVRIVVGLYCVEVGIRIGVEIRKEIGFGIGVGVEIRIGMEVGTEVEIEGEVGRVRIVVGYLNTHARVRDTSDLSNAGGNYCHYSHVGENPLVSKDFRYRHLYYYYFYVGIGLAAVYFGEFGRRSPGSGARLILDPWGTFAWKSRSFRMPPFPANICVGVLVGSVDLHRPN